MDRWARYVGASLVFLLLSVAPSLARAQYGPFCDEVCGYGGSNCQTMCPVCDYAQWPSPGCIESHWTNCGDYAGLQCPPECQGSWVYDHTSQVMGFDSWWNAPNGDPIGCKLRQGTKTYERWTCTGTLRVASCSLGAVQEKNCINGGSACWNECNYYSQVGSACN